jgi:putative transposase
MFARDQVSLGNFGVNRVCQLVGISKTTYYQAINPKDRFEQKHLNIKSIIAKVITNNPAYGIRRIKKELSDNYQVVIGRDTLSSLLKLWGLQLKRKVKSNKPNLIQKILLSLADRANLLIRTELAKPFQAISSDITELRYRGGKAYLCVHKDIVGQMVYGWSLGLNMETSLVIKSFNMAVKNLKYLLERHPIKYAGKTEKLTEKNNKLLFHQDRGSQYTSYQYVQSVLSQGIISYSNPGTPTHNPGQESFFGRFKDEWITEIAEIETFEKLQKFVEAKIKYYNYERRHTSIGLISPYNFTKSFF